MFIFLNDLYFFDQIYHGFQQKCYKEVAVHLHFSQVVFKCTVFEGNFILFQERVTGQKQNVHYLKVKSPLSVFPRLNETSFCIGCRRIWVGRRDASRQEISIFSCYYNYF